MTLEKFTEYLIAKNLNDSTIKSYLWMFGLFEKAVEVEDLSQETINRFILSHSSNITGAFLRNLFEFYNITEFKVPKMTGRKARKIKKSISPEEIKVLRLWIYHNKHVKYLILFDLSYIGGLRRSEVVGIKVSDFDLEGWNDNTKPCKLKIRSELTRGKKDRFIPVPPKLMKRIIKYIKDEEFNIDSDMFPSKMAWHKAFKHAIKETGVHDYSLHDLRRSRATKWYHEGKDLHQIKNRLGHASISTTQLYINPDEEKELEEWSEEMKGM